MLLQTKAGVVMPLQQTVGVVMPPHLALIGTRNVSWRSLPRLLMGTTLWLLQEGVVEAVVATTPRGREAHRPTARRSESLPNEVGALEGARDLWLDQGPLERYQLKILKTLGTAKISLRSGLALWRTVGAMLTTTGKSNASAVRLISAWTGVGTGSPLLSPRISLGDTVASLHVEIEGEVEIEVKSGLRAGLTS